MERIVIGGTRLADHQRRRQKADPVEQRELHGYVKPRCKQEASTKRHPPAFFTPKLFLHSILLFAVVFQCVLVTFFMFTISCLLRRYAAVKKWAWSPYHHRCRRR